MARKLLDAFNSLFGGFICISEETVELFLKSVKEESLYRPEYLYDWVLANDMADEVIL